MIVGYMIENEQDLFERTGELAGIKLRDRMKELLRHLIHNNHAEFFYLHSDPDLGIIEDSCACLRLSIGLRNAHYEILVAGRVLSLREPFRSKLGWLLGNLYARVATPEWVDHEGWDRKKFNDLIARELEQYCTWVDDKQLQKAKMTAPANLLDQTAEVIRAHVESATVEKREDRLFGVLTKMKEKGVLDGGKGAKLIEALKRDSEFRALIK